MRVFLRRADFSRASVTSSFETLPAENFERVEPHPKAVYHLNRAWARISKKDFGETLPDLNEAIRIDPTNPIAFNNRGFVHNQNGSFDLAMTDLNQAIQLDPNSASAYKNRAITFEKKNDPGKALDDFRKAIGIDPRNQDALDGQTYRGLAAPTPQVPQEKDNTPTGNAKAPEVDYSGPIPTSGLPRSNHRTSKSFDKWVNDPARTKITDINEALRSSGDVGVKDAKVRAALRSIPKSAIQYKEAQAMLADFAKQDVEARKNLKEAAHKYLAARADLRKALAKKLQTNYWEIRSRRHDRTQPQNTILNLRFVLFSNPLVYKLVNAGSFPETCRNAGFTKVVLSDGYEKTWSSR